MAIPDKSLWSDEVSADNMYFSIDVNKKPPAGCIARRVLEEGKEELERIRREGAGAAPALPLRKKGGGSGASGKKGRMAATPDDDPRPGGKPRYDKSTLYDHGELDAMDCSAKPLICPGFPVGDVGSLVSMGGVGKTFLALQMGMQIAVGRNGYDKRGVLYLAAEDQHDILAGRLQAIKKAYRWTAAELADAKLNFKMWSLRGQRPDLLEKSGGSRSLVDFIMEIAEDYEGDELQLVIFDTFRRFSSKDENDSGAMSGVLGVMEKLGKDLGCSCFFLHHVSKFAATNNKQDEQQAARGSSVLTDNIRYQEFLRPMTEGEAGMLGVKGPGGKARKPIKQDGPEARRMFAQWGVSKQNFSLPVRVQWLRRNESGVLLPVDLAVAEAPGSVNGQEKEQRKGPKKGAKEFTMR